MPSGAHSSVVAHSPTETQSGLPRCQNHHCLVELSVLMEILSSWRCAVGCLFST